MTLFQKMSWSLAVALAVGRLPADEPTVSYIFPAGGQRGTIVHFKVGGHYLNGEAQFEMLGSGVAASSRIHETNTVWFEGPVIPLPASQQAEDYPKDHAGEVRVSADAELGARFWRVWTSQGATTGRKFVVGDLPEIIEQEIEGDPIPTEVKLPVTINGRIFPREDVDLWTFPARLGERITCEVCAKRLGSPLEARLEVLDAHGKALAEATGRAGADPRVQFTAPQDGLYQVRIHDMNFDGLQHHVYRLTITPEPWVNSFFPQGGARGSTLQLQLAGHGLPSETTSVHLPTDGLTTFAARLGFAKSGAPPLLIELDNLPEQLESEPNNQPPNQEPILPPAVLNGRIDEAGDVDHWPISMKQDETLVLDLCANRLGSPMDSVLVVLDANRKELARNDNLGEEQTDSRLVFKAPTDGMFWLVVQDRFASRGGTEFAYRLRVAPPLPPDFALTFSADALTVSRDVAGLSEEEKKKRPQPKPTPLRIDAERIGGFTGEIQLTVEPLPSDLAFKGNKIAETQSRTEVTFSASATAKIGVTHVTVRGTATINGRPTIRVATLAVARGETAPDNVLLAVAMPVPFKSRGDYLLAYATRGSVYRRRYMLDRGGFKGPLIARLADRQVRHLQGVQGPEVMIPPEASEFEYPVTLPSWMEIGRTSRAAVMVSGVVLDQDGAQHLVSYSSGEQNDQIISVVSPGLLSIGVNRRSWPVQPHSLAEVRVSIQRAQSLMNMPVKVELIVPAHVRGIDADAVTVEGSKTEAVLKIRFGSRSGPFNKPAIVRATTLDSENPHSAETSLEFVPELVMNRP